MLELLFLGVGYEAEEFQGFCAVVFELVFFVGGNVNGGASADFCFSLFADCESLSFEDVDFVFPWVAVEWAVSFWFHFEEAHCKVWCAHFFCDKPTHFQFRSTFIRTSCFNTLIMEYFH